jgi:formylglycine-generating enzyme required for sulfatase activity
VLLSVAAPSPGCDDGAAPAPDKGFRIQVAPLTLPGVTDVCYAIDVRNDTVANIATAQTVWTKSSICASQYGDGVGDISYAGTCDAGRDNTVTLRIEDIFTGGAKGAGGVAVPGTEWINPCARDALGALTGYGPCQIQKPCVDNQDTPVEFNVTIMRNAKQGFFDIAVNFEDIFCSAKLDCRTGPDLSDPYIQLLHNGSDRDDTVVMALACTAGPDQATHLYWTDVTVTCGATSYVIDPAAGPGNLSGVAGAVTPAIDADNAALFQVATYRGAEQLGNAGGTPFNKLYWNIALGLEDGGQAADCTISANATAHDGALVDGITPASTTYPYIQFAANLSTCTQHELGSDEVAERYTGLATTEQFSAQFDGTNAGPSIPPGFRCAGTVCTNEATGEVAVPAGALWMGCNPVLDWECPGYEGHDDWNSWNAADAPQHYVELTGRYAIDRTEVTAANYQACMDAGACDAPAGSNGGHTVGVAGLELHPANDMTWPQAQAYCAWGGKAAGVQRLCTEAEWERAARGGCETVTGDCQAGMRTFPWGERPATDAEVCERANVPGRSCSPGTTLPVGSLPLGASPYGALDMAGNVLEWVADWFAPYDPAAPATTDPTGPAAGGDYYSYFPNNTLVWSTDPARVKRGGSYSHAYDGRARAARRDTYPEWFVSPDLGLRCCRDLPRLIADCAELIDYPTFLTINAANGVPDDLGCIRSIPGLMIDGGGWEVPDLHFDHLEEVSVVLIIQSVGTASTTEITFAALTTLPADRFMNIQNNSALGRVRFDALTSFAGMELASNTGLSAEFPALTTLVGDGHSTSQVIQSNGAGTQFVAPLLTSTALQFVMVGNSGMEALVLPSLTDAPGGIQVISNAALSTLDLSALKHVGVKFNFDSNSALSTCAIQAVLDGLTTAPALADTTITGNLACP